MTENNDVEPQLPVQVPALSGKMTKAQKALKMKLFARMLLDPEKDHSKEDIMKALSISESTYYNWSKDDTLIELSGFEPTRENIVSSIIASSMRKSALRTLGDIMDDVRAGSMARVQAAKAVLDYIPDQITDKSDVNGMKARSIILMNQPLFVNADRDVVRGLLESNAIPSDGVEDVDYEVVGEGSGE